jgi:peptidoglycan LD-endopeptidase LytH
MVSTASLKDLLKANQDQFNPVVEFDPEKDKIIKLDFTENNKELTDEILEDEDKFVHYIFQYLNNKGARYAIGGYDEHRSLYKRSSVFTTEDDEDRRLHLGIDIWGKPHTAVMAPLDGMVHSFAFNNAFGDYGATIILTHQLEGQTFYTLYGHLSLNSLKNLTEGDRVEKGDKFAEFGMPMENGHWPPHLHFQIISDLQGYKGDFPGVCKYSEREKYLANSPDPDIILQMTKHAE